MRNQRKDSMLIRLCLLAFLGIAGLFLVYQGGRWYETKTEKPETRGNPKQRFEYDYTIEHNGTTYRKRKDLTTILLMGVDNVSEKRGMLGNRNGGQADFLRLIVIDKTEKAVHQIQIDRDTMTPITILGVMGNKSGVRTAQVCLSHGFGDGQHQSCELTAEAISNLMFGVPIDLYLAMNMDGISVLNDLIGGVTVTLQDDFSSLDPAMTKGTTLTLAGDQAEYFVRYRMNIGIGTNEARMARQETYISCLTDILLKRSENDKEFMGNLFDSMSEYLTTNVSRGRLINEVWAAKAYDRKQPLKPEGYHGIGPDGFMQFHVNEEKLQQMVLSMFFEKV